VRSRPGSRARPINNSERRNKFAVASATCGLASIVLCFLFVANLLAIGLGTVALAQIRHDPSYTNRHEAIIGIILGVVTLAIWLLVWWLLETERIIMSPD
jgi:protein-S-isoprenylcysteine O-methyltransferase Ste14